MTTSQTTMSLPRPAVGQRIALGTKGYFRSRNRRRIHQLLLDAFRKSGLTQADLKTMLGIDAGRISRMLSSPANLELDTISDFILAVTLGQELAYGLAASPYDKPPRNHVGQSLFPDDAPKMPTFPLSGPNKPRVMISADAI